MRVSGKYKNLLIVVTIAIWAFVIMRYFNIGFFSINADSNPVVAEPLRRNMEDLEVRSFNMGEISHDPFKISPIRKKSPQKTNSPQQKDFTQQKYLDKVTLRTEKKDSLNIKYHGLIKNENGSTKMFFSFNGSGKIMDIGDAQNDFRLKSANADSAVLFNAATKANLVFKAGSSL